MIRSVRLAVMIGLVAACMLYSLLGLVALRRGGRCQVGSLTLIEIAAGYDRRADQDLASDRPTMAALSEAGRLSRAAIAQYPYDTRAWSRLAYIDRLEHGVLTPAGAADLQRSYDLVGIDPDIGVWRIRFALENSQAIPRDVRRSVREEVSALWTFDDDRARIVNLKTAIQNPAGRLSLALWVNQLQTTAAK